MKQASDKWRHGLLEWPGDWYVCREAGNSPFVRKCLVERFGEVYQIRRDPEVGFDDSGPEVMSRQEAADWVRGRGVLGEFCPEVLAHELLVEWIHGR